MTNSTATDLTIEHVRAAMRGPLLGPKAQITMAPRPRSFNPLPGVEPREAGVLLVLYPIHRVLHLVLTVRTSGLNYHGGQISLPGGGWEEVDASLQETALREAQEEIGVVTDGLEVLGPLTPLYIPPSNNIIHPFVAYTPQRPAFQPDPSEVAELLDVPLPLLLDPATRREEDWTWRGAPLHVPFYAVGEHKVWGATAIVLAEFLALLARRSGALRKRGRSCWPWSAIRRWRPGCVTPLAGALTQLGHAEEKVLSGLLALARDPQVEVWMRGNAASALEKLGRTEEKVLDGLLALARDEKVDNELRSVAYKSLKRLVGGAVEPLKS